MKKEKNRAWAIRTLIRAAVALWMLWTVNTNIFPVSAAQDAQGGKLRVGFFSFDGYHMMDRYGNRSGYGYDYLQYLARYADFRYEYIGYDKSWDEMQDMLAAGEIDLLTSAQKTKERMKRFDFSDRPIGSSAAILTVRAGDNRYMVDDYTKLDNIRIGMLEGNSRNDDLKEFAGENGFSYRAFMYSSEDALVKALQEGKEIDAALTSNLRKSQNEWIVATFDTTPFYIMVQKGNQGLLDRINQAVARLQTERRDVESELFERYYKADSGDEIPYTAAEREYIKSMVESGRTVRVTINSGREPVSYFVDGEARGIIPEIAREVLRRTGLPYEFVDTPPTVDAREFLTKGAAQVRFDGTADLNDAERNGLRVTDPYLQLPVSCLTRKSFVGKPGSVAVIRNSDVVEQYVLQVYGEASITRYDSAAQCLEAVLKGEQDAAFYQTYIAQRLVNEDIRNRIKEQLVPGYTMNFAVSVKREEPLLFSILDKAVFSMSSEEINRIVLGQTAYLAQKVSLAGYLYAHPGFSVLLVAAAAVFAIILILYISRQKNLQLEKEKTREFERFISYVCRANNSVIEIRPQEQNCLSYQVKDGKVCCEQKPLYKKALRIERIHPQDRERVDALTSLDRIPLLIENGGELYFECRVETEEKGCYRWFSYTLQGVAKDNNNPGSLMLFEKDIDQAKREEEEKRQALQDALRAAQQAGEARGTFLSRMSHEIRTPLNAIIGYLTIAGSSLENRDKTEECLKKSEFAARQLLSIVNDVLDISAIESGKMKIAHESFNIRQLLSGITSIFHTQAEEKGVIFRVRLKGLTEETLTGDEFRLNQILLNLLSNAVKFTPEGGQVTLTVVQRNVMGGQVYLQFQVEDTGIGMTEDCRRRLFMPYEQQDATTARKYGGTGLGLSITRNLVSMMNGTMDVKSRENRGSLFTVNLSFEAEERQRGMVELYDFSGLHVLALYDENSDYRYMQTLLERLGVNYDLALNREEALRRLTEKKEWGEEYDVCLIDWDIPDGKALEAVKAVTEAASPHCPALLLVAYQPPELTEAEKSLIEDTILKPVFQSSLFDVLSNICRRQSTEKEEGTEDGKGNLAGVRILLAEDNTLNMEIAQEILTGYGLIVDSAENGKKAAERFEQSKEGTYQAILMDIQMPVMNGYEAAKRIRAGNHPQASSIPIIALTADAFREDINRSLAAGMNDHVSKPIDFAGLCRVLGNYLPKEPV